MPGHAWSADEERTLAEMVQAGATDQQIVAKLPGRSLRAVTQKRQALGLEGGKEHRESHYAEPLDAPEQEPAAEAVEHTFTADDISRIASLEDLLAFFKVDTERWEVRDYRVNKWEQASKDKRTQQPVITPLYQVRANLIPSLEDRERRLREILDELVADMREHAPATYRPIQRRALSDTDDPVLWMLSLRDAHFGMLAWGKEVGEDYDLSIAVEDYGKAVEHLLGYAGLYPVERILYLAGDDLLHVDGPAGNGSRGGATTAGTQQDIDSRLAKQFTAARRALVAGIDRARQVAPVDVVFVPGNHDEQQTYRLGEVIHAWYRNDPEVSVTYSPKKRHFYGYGRNAFMFTHGTDYKRKRDSLPLIFATECPADIWTASEGGCREIHTGHSHIHMQGGYYPTAEVDETRAIRTRSLPGLTPEDSWHYTEGYKHRRTAMALAFRKSGGPAGVHEFNL